MGNTYFPAMDIFLIKKVYNYCKNTLLSLKNNYAECLIIVNKKTKKCHKF